MSEQTAVTTKERLLYKEEIIGEIIKSDDLKLVIEHCVYEKHPYIDFHIYWKVDKGEDKGKFVPTKKAITITLNEELPWEQWFSLMDKLKEHVKLVFEDEAEYGNKDNKEQKREF